MYDVTTKQMNAVLRTIGKSMGAQQTVFSELDFNPYDNYSNGVGDVSGVIIIPKRDIEKRLKEEQEDPFNYGRFPEERMDEIEAGAPLTQEEIEIVKAKYIDECIADDGSVFAALTNISDGERKVYVLYAEQTQGQGGLHIVDFYGFFETEKSMRKAMQSFEDVIFHDMFA